MSLTSGISIMSDAARDLSGRPPDGSSQTGSNWNTAASDRRTGSDVGYLGPWGHGGRDASWPNSRKTAAHILFSSPRDLNQSSAIVWVGVWLLCPAYSNAGCSCMPQLVRSGFLTFSQALLNFSKLRPQHPRGVSFPRCNAVTRLPTPSWKRNKSTKQEELQVYVHVPPDASGYSIINKTQ